MARMNRMGLLPFLSVVCDRLITNRSRADTLELQRPGDRSRSGDLDLQGPGAACSARACPSHAFCLKQDFQDLQDGQDEGEIAGDRPPHYEKNAPRARSARACPSQGTAEAAAH